MAVAVGTMVLYSMLDSDFGSKNRGAEGDQVPAIATKILADYFAADDAYNVWVFPDGEPSFYRSALAIGTDPGTIAEIV